MTPADFLPLLSGPAAAVVILVWMVWMQRQDIKEMRRALDAANARATVADEAARTTLAALQHPGRARPGPGMSGGAAMKKPEWWPVRKTRQIADEAEAAAARTHREVSEPLRQMRRGDFLAPAIAEDIRRQQDRK